MSCRGDRIANQRSVTNKKNDEIQSFFLELVQSNERNATPSTISKKRQQCKAKKSLKQQRHGNEERRPRFQAETIEMSTKKNTKQTRYQIENAITTQK